MTAGYFVLEVPLVVLSLLPVNLAIFHYPLDLPPLRTVYTSVHFVLPYRHLTGLVEMLQTMDKLAPGVASRHTLLYGVEVKFYSCRPQLSPVLETEVSNMFAAGDGAGVSRSLIQASASGVVAAREILRRSGHNLLTG